MPLARSGLGERLSRNNQQRYVNLRRARRSSPSQRDPIFDQDGTRLLLRWKYGRVQIGRVLGRKRTELGVRRAGWENKRLPE